MCHLKSSTFRGWFPKKRHIGHGRENLVMCSFFMESDHVENQLCPHASPAKIVAGAVPQFWAILVLGFCNFHCYCPFSSPYQLRIVQLLLVIRVPSVYPLVKHRKTMENHHFSWENSLWMAIFHVMWISQRVTWDFPETRPFSWGNSCLPLRTQRTCCSCFLCWNGPLPKKNNWGYNPSWGDRADATWRIIFRGSLWRNCLQDATPKL